MMVARSLHESTLSDAPNSHMATLPVADRTGTVRIDLQTQAVCRCASFIIFLSLLAAYAAWA